MFDEIAQRYFETPELFAQGIELLQKYKDAEARYETFGDFQQHFLDHLDDSTDNESRLITLALRYIKARQLSKGDNPYLQQTTKSTFTADEVLQIVQNLQSSNTPVASPVSTATAPSPSISIHQAIDEFILEKKQNWKADSDSESAYRNEIFPLFLEVTQLAKTDDLNINHVIAYKNVILKYPCNRRKKPKYRDWTIKKIIDTPIPEVDQLSPTTKSTYLQKLGTFLQWLSKNNYAAPNLDAPLKGIIKKSVRSYEARNQYADADLRKLFNSNQYVNGRHDQAYKFWVPLLGLFTGARLNEICQLHVDDILKFESTDIWVIHINENNADTTLKSVKRPFHQRFVPIHKQLIAIGFLEYVAHMGSKNQKRLFPELEYGGIKNKFGNTAQRWFNNTYTNHRNCNITTPQTSFHSLRHTVSNYFANKLNLVESKYAYALGQTPSGGVSLKTYVKPDEMTELKKNFDRIKYDSIDFSIITPWKRQRFAPRGKT